MVYKTIHEKARYSIKIWRKWLLDGKAGIIYKFQIKGRYKMYKGNYWDICN